jgi:hypothetical protein
MIDQAPTKAFDSEAGAFSVLFSVILGIGLIALLATLVLDGGEITVERRVLQNVAESSAIALAKECATDSQACKTSMTPEILAQVNSPDALTKITEICVKGVNRLLQPCEPTSSSRLDCMNLPPGANNYVRIRTQTLSKDGGQIEPLFGGDESHQLNGCAQAIWGNASSAEVFAPFAFSICQWALFKTGQRVILEFEENQGVETCNYTFTDLQGQSYTKKGISGWATVNLLSNSLTPQNRASEPCPDPNTDTPAKLSIGDALSPITKSSSSQDFCDDSNLANKFAVWIGKEVYLPLVATEKTQGQSTKHTVEAFSGFRFYGYSIRGNRGGTYPSGNWCSNNKSCIHGEFTVTLSPGSDLNLQPGTPNVGLQAIKLT